MSTRLMILLVLATSTGGYAHAAGYTDNVKISEVLTSSTTASGREIIYPRTDHPKVTAQVVELPVGVETGWHSQPAPSYVWVTSGTLTLEIEGGKSLRYQEGDAMIGAVNIPQNLKNNGDRPVRFMVFYTGADDVPNVVRTTVYDAGKPRHEAQTIPQHGSQPSAAPEPQAHPEPPKKDDNSIKIKLRYQQPVIE